MKRTPLQRKTPLIAHSQLARTPFRTKPATDGQGGSYSSLPRRSQPLAPHSAKGATKQRERMRVLREMFPAGEFHQCAFPGCTNEATDPHEPLTRARGGSITDPNNIAGVCRQHHKAGHAEDPAMYDAGLMRHSWDPAGSADNTQGETK